MYQSQLYIFANIDLLSRHNNPVRPSVWFLFQRWGNWGTEQFINLKGGSSSATVLTSKLMKAGSRGHALLHQTPSNWDVHAHSAYHREGPSTSTGQQKDDLVNKCHFEHEETRKQWGSIVDQKDNWGVDYGPKCHIPSGFAFLATPSRWSFEGRVAHWWKDRKRRLLIPHLRQVKATFLSPHNSPPCPKRGLHTMSAIPTSWLSFSVLGAAHVQDSWTRGQASETEAQPGHLTGYCLGQICTNFKQVSLVLEVFQTKFWHAVEFSFRNHFTIFRHSVVFKNSRE